MLLGDYYDAVIKESEKIASGPTNDVDQVKTAEAISQLDEAGCTFESEKDATAAIEEVIENDYAEKVAAVTGEFDIDEVVFNNDEEKVAAAMEVVDGWEASVVGESE